MADDTNAFDELDSVLADADFSASPWRRPAPERDLVYQPDFDVLRRLLEVPINQGHSRKQQSGRVAKSVDAWIAHELRRAGFPPNAVWPRTTIPRVLPGDLARVEQAVEVALARLDEFQIRYDAWAAKAAKAGFKASPPSLKQTRSAVSRVLTTGKNNPLPGYSNANILGRFYVKQVDVAVSSWEHGPEILISTKTQFSSYLNNKNNRYEEAVGEATNLRDRHPMAAMGFAYVVRDNVFKQEFAFAYLRDLLVRLRKPDGPFDATMLLSASWFDPWDGLDEETRKAEPGLPKLDDVEDGASTLSASRFFEDIVTAVTANTPVDRHREVRERMAREPMPGGLPPESAATVENLDDIDLDALE